MNPLDATIATLGLAMEFALRRDCQEMYEHYAEIYDAAVERKMDEAEGDETLIPMTQITL